MQISQKMNKAINEQIGREFGASLQYVAIAAYFDGQSLPQLARYFYKQADEERGHAMRFIGYLLDAGAGVNIPAVSGPKAEFGSAEECVKLSLRWEQEVTKQIYGLMELAIKESDYTTQQFLQWFISEQLEEVSSMEKLLAVVRRAGEGGLLLVEDYLAREGHPEDKD
ncbi:MAG: ferritin [Armatimonadota bacterium]|nr:ferritin [Armatimonadota bacterium]MDR7511363.1 ferritin [Armatimonadota bacterium]